MIAQTSNNASVGENLKKPLKKLWRFMPPIRYAVTYSVWVLAIRLITLTFITYFIISPTSRLQDISEAFSSYEVGLMGTCALLFVALIYGLNPLSATPIADIINREKFFKSFVPGFVQGTFVAGGIVLAFLVSGTYRYWGSFIQMDEFPIELANVLLRVTTLAALAYCEEFIFRKKIFPLLKLSLPSFAAIQITALIYCGIKVLQFDLGIMQLITLYLVSVSLSYRMLNEESFSRGAGIWAAILIVFHPFLSLPIFGNDFSGILLIKHQAASLSKFTSSNLDNLKAFTRILSGGAGGPLASFAFQLLLILDIGRSILKRKK